MNKNLMDLLYRSFDEHLTPDEQELLDKALIDEKDLQNEKRSLEQIRSGVSKTRAKSFSPGFANRIMQSISDTGHEAGDRLFESIYVLFRPIAIAASIIILVMATINFYKSDTISWESAIVLPEVSVQDAYDPVVVLNMESYNESAD